MEARRIDRGHRESAVLPSGARADKHRRRPIFFLALMLALPLLLLIGGSALLGTAQAAPASTGATGAVAQITPTMIITITVIAPTETPGQPITPTVTPPPPETPTPPPPVTPTETLPPTATLPPPETETPAPTATDTAPATPTLEPTETATEPATDTPAPTDTLTPPATDTPAPTATDTPLPTSTTTPTTTREVTATWTPTLPLTPTAPPTGTATLPATPTPLPTTIATPTVPLTATPAPTATAPAPATPAMLVARPAGVLPGIPAIQLVQVASGLADPVHVTAPRDGSGRLFIVERVGRIRIVQQDELLATPFLDISALVRYDSLDQGLLGLAFHPNYAENGRFFVYYTDWRTNGDSFLVEYQVSTDPNRAELTSGRVLLTHNQPYVNHNGGTLAFGPDGYLYVALGDGGLAGDPYGNAQDRSSLLGKLLRINVDGDGGHGYGIPTDNPFLHQVLEAPAALEIAQSGHYRPNARPEVWAYGLRNPWHFSFDPATGDLYLPDGGQNRWEEINFQPAGAVGGSNYGWPLLEASHCYPAERACEAVGVLPVAEYERGEVHCGIVGIGVYRGQVSPSLTGIYISADSCSGTFWGLTRDPAEAWLFAELGDSELRVSGGGMDELGELYVTTCPCVDERGYDPTTNPNGAVWRLFTTE
jgi:glucose/arabinose dehydrogenase